MIRTTLSILAFVSALFLPVWVTCILALVLIAVYQAPEVIVLGVVIDLLYMPPGGVFFIPMPATLGAIALIWIMIPIHERLMVGEE